MSMMQSEVFDAFRSIGVDEAKALKAVTALNERDKDVTSMKGDILVLKWMTGFVMAMVTALFLKQFIH